MRNPLTGAGELAPTTDQRPEAAAGENPRRRFLGLMAAGLAAGALGLLGLGAGADAQTSVSVQTRTWKGSPPPPRYYQPPRRSWKDDPPRRYYYRPPPPRPSASVTIWKR